MEAVIKVGGSLAEDPISLRILCYELSKLAKRYRILIVPGGGKLADVVREFDGKFVLSSNTSHKMAILCMDQFGLLISEITPNSRATYSLSEAKVFSKSGALPIFLPSKLMFREDPLEHSWDVTSDSIAAYIALKIRAKRLILVTDVDGIFSNDPKEDPNAKLIEQFLIKELLSWNKRTSVDRFLPKMLLGMHLNCYVVNGKYHRRIQDILEDRKTVCTKIIT